MSDTNLEAANRVFDHPPAQPPYVSFFDIIELKGALGSRGSWKERLAVGLALWLASALTRDFAVRRLFCVALATEMRRANEWLDQQAPSPPNSPKK